MPAITLQRTFYGSVSASNPTLSMSILNFMAVVVGTAGAPADILGNGSVDSTGQECYSWIGFDISSIPTSAIISSATLRLTTFFVNPTLSVYDGVDISTRCLSLDTVINPSTTTFLTAPNSSLNTNTVITNLDTAYSFTIAMNADVLNIVKTRLALNYTNKMIYFRLTSVDGSEGVNFDTLDIYLDLTYTVPSGALFFGSD